MDFINEYLKLMDMDWFDVKRSTEHDANNILSIYNNMKDDLIKKRQYINNVIELEKYSKRQIATLEYIMHETEAALKTYIKCDRDKKTISDETDRWEVFKVLKGCYLKGKNLYRTNNISREYRTYNYAGNDFVDRHNSYDDMSDILKGADRFYRGSSDEYKEIQHELKDLSKCIHRWKNCNTASKRRYVVTMVNALIEKTNDYITDRMEIGVTYGANSYKGKRFDAMCQVNTYLKGIMDTIKEQKFLRKKDYNIPVSDEYKEIIAKKVSNGRFNKALFTEYQGLKNSEATIHTLMDNEKVMQKTENVLSLDTMKKGLKGRIIEAKKQNTLWEGVKKKVVGAVETVKNIKSDKDVKNFMDNMKSNKKYLDRMNKEHDKVVTAPYNIDYLEPDNYYGNDLGVITLDMAAYETVDNIYKVAEARLPKKYIEPQISMI